MKNPRAFLKKQAEQAREMHRLYPFTRTRSSAWFRAHKRKPQR